MDGNGYKLELYVAASPAYSLRIQVLTVQNCHVLLFASQLKKILCVFMTALLNRTSADKLLLHHNN